MDGVRLAENPVHTSLVSSPTSNVRAVQRRLAALLPEARPAGVGERTLEIAAQSNDAPRLISATVLEKGALRARRVFDPPQVGFRAFLDGTQRSHALVHLDGVPIVHGSVAAVIRERRNQRMHTWQAPLVEARVYCPRALVPPSAWHAIVAEYGHEVVDTSADAEALLAHPFALRDAAVRLVEAHREELERRLAERWCSQERDPLFVDGNISGSDVMARSGCTVGVVKTHRTLYAEGDALSVILSLGQGERSSVFSVVSRRRPVASWYLRLRDWTDHDPMWGLVRVELAHPAPPELDRIGTRADEVSRWILAESSPLALPDARWDKMVYGIRDCEEFLRAIQ